MDAFISPATLESWLTVLDSWSFILGFGLLGLEFLWILLSKRLTKNLFLDQLASLSTQVPSLAIEVVSFTALLLIYYGLSQTVALFDLPITGWTVLLVILAADFAYYWEHRASHRIRLFWVTHAVHHSSPEMNIAVAYRFGALDSFVALLFHAPLVVLGFDPLLVILGQVVVLVYQTWLHTEAIGKLGPLEGVINTPSAHRVHHGSDELYLDKNYGGILMLWDRLFGSYQAEEARPTYGLTVPINSVNPLKVWTSELLVLIRDFRRTENSAEVFGTLFGPPGWLDKRKETGTAPEQRGSD
ncbi:sterol desaturase family protein [Rhodovibrionaceae bacterium A322]